MSKNLFETHWSATKTALCEGLSGNRKKVMEVVLENTKKDVQHQAARLQVTLLLSTRLSSQ